MKQSKKDSSKKAKKAPSKGDKWANALLGIAALAVVGLIVYVVMQPAPEKQPVSSAAIQRAAQVQTLDPAMFSGKAREAYQAAKDVPEVLVQVGCYCGCMQNNGHEHNLHCFTDLHGDT